MCIYISPICNIESRFIFSVEIIKLGILYFSLFTDTNFFYKLQRHKYIILNLIMLKPQAIE